MQQHRCRTAVCFFWFGGCVATRGIVWIRFDYSTFSSAHVRPLGYTCIGLISSLSPFSCHFNPFGNAINSMGHATLQTEVNDRCGGRQLSAPESPIHITISTVVEGTIIEGMTLPGGSCSGSRGWSSGGGGLGVGKTKPLASLGVAFQGLFACLWFGSTVAESTGQHAQHVGLLAQPLFSFWARMCVFDLHWLKHILVQAVFCSHVLCLAVVL